MHKCVAVCRYHNLPRVSSRLFPAAPGVVYQTSKAKLVAAPPGLKASSGMSIRFADRMQWMDVVGRL